MLDPTLYPLLSAIQSPADLKPLQPEQRTQLSDELRQYLIDTLDQCGGHFGANLGTVELAVALHTVFNTPEDALIWDVGHQAYPHKILTGRAEALHSIRQPGGLSPFPKRSESAYDAFGTGHSSTSISAALGFAVANCSEHPDRRAIAVIGDGGLTGGMAFEALNHGGAIDANLLVILNDNDMSISNNVGALTHYLGRILSGKTYGSLREGSKKMLAHIPPISRLAKKTETHLKGMIVPGTLFEELGFNYLGPIDGHDVNGLVDTLSHLSQRKGAKLLHVITTKGKGYSPAEAEQVRYHAVSPGFRHTPPPQKNEAPSQPTYSQIFGQWLCDTAQLDQKLHGITPAMCEGSAMQKFSTQFPDRYHDVGIAEQHSVTFAAGLACAGLKPVVAIYASFLQRAYDQLIHDVALQHLDVTFAIDRAGLVGPDGPTHAGRCDLSFMRCVPNMVIMAPADEQEAYDMLTTAYRYPGPAAVRYPRGKGPGKTITDQGQAVPIGKACYARIGNSGIAILAFGSMLTPALTAAETLDATVVNMRFIKPLDEDIIDNLIETHQLLVTVEENTVIGGAGSAVNEFVLNHDRFVSVMNLGLPDQFIEHGDHASMLADCGLDATGIERSVQARMNASKKMANIIEKNET